MLIPSIDYERSNDDQVEHRCRRKFVGPFGF